VNASPTDPQLFSLLIGAVRTGLEFVRLADTGKTWTRTHDNWPDLRWHDNGLPYVTYSDGPRDYSQAVSHSSYAMIRAIGRDSQEEPPDFAKTPEFLALLGYAQMQPRLRDHLLRKNGNDYWVTRLQVLVGCMVDRYVHLNDTLEMDEGRFLPIYQPIERWLTDSRLPIIVVVPILLLKFDFKSFTIDGNISVEKLSDDLNLGRAWHGPWGDSRSSLLESSASHALCLSNGFIENQTSRDLDHEIMSPHSYPIELIDAFFAAIRISTGHATGYAQLLTFPVGWASHYTASLTPIEGPSIEAYPPTFEDGAWNDEVATVTINELEQIKQTFENMQAHFGAKHGKRLRLAIDRLNLSSLRTRDEDGVIDAMIAMEALLSDGEQEMTHKVALRLAALYKFAGDPRCEQAFDEMKQIYKFRSKVVHGSSDFEKWRELIRDGNRIPAAGAAVEHLRSTLAVVTANPTFLNPKNIDRYLLTGKGDQHG
jgi:hypothetical protein